MTPFWVLIIAVSGFAVLGFLGRKFNGEINRHLKGCSVQWDTKGKDERWLLVFHIELDDPDPEFEDW